MIPAMDSLEIRRLVALEDRPGGDRERRAILARRIRRLRPGLALGIGAAGGGNTACAGRRLAELALVRPGRCSRSPTSGGCRSRALTPAACRSRAAPLTSSYLVRRVGAHPSRTSRRHRRDAPGAAAGWSGRCVAVPSDPKLWSTGTTWPSRTTFGRYTRDALVGVIEEGSPRGSTRCGAGTCSCARSPAWRRKKLWRRFRP